MPAYAMPLTAAQHKFLTKSQSTTELVVSQRAEGLQTPARCKPTQQTFLFFAQLRAYPARANSSSGARDAIWRIF